jgi:hypothetical protein
MPKLSYLVFLLALLALTTIEVVEAKPKNHIVRCATSSYPKGMLQAIYQISSLIMDIKYLV